MITDCISLPTAKRLTSGIFSVGDFAWSPDWQQLLFNKLAGSLFLAGITSDIVVLNIATKKMDILVNNPTGDFLYRWSPYGRALFTEAP